MINSRIGFSLRLLKPSKAVIVFSFLFLFFCVDAFAQKMLLSKKDIQRIAEKVFNNECSGKEEYLLVWNEGEEFLSLGIGHFIWYPKGKKGPFEEGFVKFLSYLRQKGEEIPEWLDENPFPSCPWESKEIFLRDINSQKAKSLRRFLVNSKSQQALFLVERLNEALPLILRNVKTVEKERVRNNFNQISKTPAGIYALVDYINFKGLGVYPSERYKGKGWGLLQVLSLTKDQCNDSEILAEFVRAAIKLLEDRVRNSPQERNEKKWLPGWKKRVRTYLYP